MEIAGKVGCKFGWRVLNGGGMCMDKVSTIVL
jgi:hypothetical protein